MKNTRKHIDDFFKEKLGGYSEQPPADAWSDLDKRLDTLVPQAPPTSPYRWVGHVAMVSVIAVLSVSLVKQFVGKNKKENEIVKEQTINKLENTNSTINVNNSTAGIAATNVPTMGTGSDGDDGNQAGGSQGQVAGTGGSNMGNTGNANGKPDNNKGGKQANYAPYNNGLANVGGKVSNPANTKTFNSSVNGNEVEQKVEEVAVNGNVNQFVAKNGENDIQSAKPAVTAPKASDAKQPDVKKAQPETKKADAKKPHQKPDFARWDAGVKGGYERGFNNGTTKYVIAPYLQYNISKKVAIMMQPGVKFANSPMKTIGSPKAYYTVNADGKVVDNGSYVSTVIIGTGVDTTYHAKYRYTQTHDSIVKTNKAGGKYMEYELPVMFKYNVSKKVSVYGGTNIVFSQMKGVKEETYTKAGIMRTVDTTISGEVMASAPALNDIIKYNDNNGSPFSSYNGPLYPAPQDNRIRFGAIMGFSYEYSDRWLLDALIQRNPAPKDIRGGYNINAPLSATYFRLSVGYKLTK